MSSTKTEKSKLVIISNIKPLAQAVHDLSQTKHISYIQQPDSLKHTSEISAATSLSLLCSHILSCCLEATEMLMLNAHISARPSSGSSADTPLGE